MPTKFRSFVVSAGFTLIELLVVISVIGILATLVTANLSSARSRARDAERKSDLKNIQTALRLYFNDHGRYPRSTGSGNIIGCGATGTNLCPWGSEWNNGTTIYMSTLPKDPSTSTQYYLYQLGSDTDNYTLSSCLENKSDTACKSISIPGWTCPSDCVFQVSQ